MNILSGRHNGARRSKRIVPKETPYRQDKKLAIEHNIPPSLRRHAKHYGIAVEQIIRQQQQSGEGKRIGERK